MIEFITALGAMMTKKTRPTFSPEFRLETAQLVFDQSYTHQEAANAMGVDYSTLRTIINKTAIVMKGKKIVLATR